jgi:hypothetical protein
MPMGSIGRFTLRESDEADYGEADYGEADYGEADYGEADYSEARPRYWNPRPYYRPGGGVSGGVVQTGAGQTQIQFSKPLVSREEYTRALEQIRRDITNNTRAIANLDKRFSIGLKRLKESTQQAQSSSMLPLLFITLLAPDPKLNSLTFQKGQPVADGVPLNVVDSKFQKQDLLLPILLISMMGTGGTGGLFGPSDKGTDSQQQMMMLLIVFALLSQQK